MSDGDADATCGVTARRLVSGDTDTCVHAIGRAESVGARGDGRAQGPAWSEREAGMAPVADAEEAASAVASNTAGGGKGSDAMNCGWGECGEDGAE